MIVILGCSASGKSTIERKLTEHGWNRIISYTTRPVRTGEVDNIDYHFISKSEFAEKNAAGFFAEDTTYNGWYYGIAKEDCCDDAIAVVETTGFRQLRANKDLHVISFYIQVEERDRVIRMMKRGDNVMESFRRIISDQGTFAGIEREVDWVIANPEGQMESAVVQILERVVREREWEDSLMRHLLPDENEDWIEDVEADPDNDINPFYDDDEEEYIDWDEDEYPEQNLLGC